MAKKSTVIETDDIQIKIYINNPRNNYSQRGKAVIRIEEDVYDSLACLSSETRTSICELASAMIRFAQERTTIIEKNISFDGNQETTSLTKAESNAPVPG